VRLFKIILEEKDDEIIFEVYYINNLKMSSKKIFIVGLLLFITIYAWSQMSVDSNRVLRILSFNILHGATTKGDFNLDVIAKVISEAKPDFVALQEVDYKTNRAKKYDLVQELGFRTNMTSLFGRAMYYDDGEYGKGILTKYTLLKSRVEALPYTADNEPRAALEIVTAINKKDTIAFIGTHLDHTKNENDRIDQALEINEIFLLNKYPTILAGDLNAEPGSKPINILEEIWTASYRVDSLINTYPSDYPVSKIDYIMFYPENRWRVLETKVIQDTLASDHCAFLVVLELLD